MSAWPALSERDAELVAALTESSGRRVRLRDLVHDYDWLNRAIPTFDDVSYGLPRLVAAGLASVPSGPGQELRFQATPAAVRLRKSIAGHPASAIAALIGASDKEEDRSLGRLVGLTPQAWDEAIRAHSAWVERWSRPFVALARLLARWQRR